MRCVVVTGAGGLLGNALQQYVASHPSAFDAKWVFLRRSECDVRESAQLEETLLKNRATHVLHLAAVVGGISYNIEHPVETLRDNILMATSVLNACMKCRIEKLVSVLSTCIFPLRHQEEFCETKVFDGAPEETNAGYAYAKRALLSLSHAYSTQYGLKAVCLIPPNLYGPHDKFDERAHVVGALIRKSFEAVANGSLVVNAFGTGVPRRQFLFAADMAEALVWALANYEDAVEPLIVSDSGDVQVREIADQIVRIVDDRLAVAWDETKPDGQMRKLAVNSKYLRLRPGATFTPLGDGLRETIEWYRKHVAAEHVRDQYWFPLCKNRISVADRMAAVRLLATDAFLSSSTYVEQLETEFSKAIGSVVSIFVNSGSSANLLMLAVMKYKFAWAAGTKIAVPAVCWSTSVWPIVQLGFVPVFVDADVRTLQMSVADLERKFEEHPDIKGVLLVHVLGGCPNMNDVTAVCTRHGAVLLEDACEVMGNSFERKSLGTFGKMGTYSTYYSHHMCSVEGGFVVSDDVELRDVLKSMRAHGWIRGTQLQEASGIEDKRFVFVLPGFNFRNTELAAVIALEQLTRLTAMNACRVDNMCRVKHMLSARQRLTQLVTVPEELPGAHAIAWLALPLILHESVCLRRYKEMLQDSRVETRPIISGNFVRQPGLQAVDVLKQRPEDFPGAEHIHHHGLYVGLHAERWSDTEVEALCQVLIDSALKCNTTS